AEVDDAAAELAGGVAGHRAAGDGGRGVRGVAQPAAEPGGGVAADRAARHGQHPAAPAGRDTEIDVDDAADVPVVASAIGGCGVAGDLAAGDGHRAVGGVA